MKLINKDSYQLSTGKIIHPNCGIIGISEKGNEFNIFEGYDGSWITEKNVNGNGFDRDDIELTNAELKEIAIYMCSLWQKFANEL